MKKRWFRNLLGGLSLTSALFVFQACYGSPQHDPGDDVYIEGYVRSKTTGDSIQGIKVSIPAQGGFELTDEKAFFSFHSGDFNTAEFLFEDADSTQNGSYANLDTIVNNTTGHIFLNISLEDK